MGTNLFKLEIETGNAAFEDDPQELGRLLGIVAEKVNDGRTEGVVKDANGLRVGNFWFEDGTSTDTDSDRD